MKVYLAAQSSTGLDDLLGVFTSREAARDCVIHSLGNWICDSRADECISEVETDVPFAVYRPGLAA